MLHRIFIAINLPKSAKEELGLWQERFSSMPARWAKPEYLHVTLVFYGSASDKELEEIKAKTKEAVKKYKPFTLQLSSIAYGPNAREPRMIWAAGESPKELLSLQAELAKILERVEKRRFSLHLTLARFGEWEFKRIDPEERPEIHEEISIKIPARSIEIMESKLKRGGAEYKILESVRLTDSQII